MLTKRLSNGRVSLRDWVKVLTGGKVMRGVDRSSPKRDKRQKEKVSELQKINAAICMNSLTGLPFLHKTLIATLLTPSIIVTAAITPAATTIVEKPHRTSTN